MKRLKEYLRRNGLNISLVIIVLSLAAIFLINAITLNQLQRQLDNQQKITHQIRANGNERASQLKRLNDHIDCIVELMSRPNRQNITITDIQGCKLASQPASSTSPAPQKSTQLPEAPRTTSPPRQPEPVNPPQETSKGLLEDILGGIL